MTYKAKIGGKDYVLPPRTIDVDERIEEISVLDKKYASGEINRREAVQTQLDFVEQFAAGALPSIDEVDTNELLDACINIISAYNTPAMKIKAESQAAAIRPIMERPEVKKLLDAAAKAKK